MKEELIKEIYSTDGDRRVNIIRNSAEIYQYQEFYFSRHPNEMCWIPRGRKSVGIYDTAERAESEARRNIDWLTDQSIEEA